MLITSCARCSELNAVCIAELLEVCPSKLDSSTIAMDIVWAEKKAPTIRLVRHEELRVNVLDNIHVVVLIQASNQLLKVGIWLHMLLIEQLRECFTKCCVQDCL